jgi:ABC-2 type transport system ATP-binding protein
MLSERSGENSDQAIATADLCKSFGTREVLGHVDLTVNIGEVFGFLGPNGSGKTTTIRLLLDLLRPTSGSIRVLGLDPRRAGVALRRRIGYLPADFVIYGGQSVDAALTGLARLRGGVERRRIVGLADRLELDLHRKACELSSGTRQKVALVQAFMHQPELLILDEPTDGLDPILRQRFVDMVKEVRADGRPVFLSSHILSEVQATADRVGMIGGGRILATDSVHALRERAVRSVEIEFATQVDPADFAGVEQLHEITLEAGPDGSILRGQLAGSADALVKAAARQEVRSLRVTEPDLEQVFLALYEEGDSRAAP